MVGKWIDISNQPDKSGSYLVYDPNNACGPRVGSAWYTKGQVKWAMGCGFIVPTYWMVLPDPPSINPVR